MLNYNKTIKFIYRYEENDDNSEHDMFATLQHTTGRELASINDVILDDSKCHEIEKWGYYDYFIVREGLYEYANGEYTKIWG
jgi:hypothetical protein